MFPSKFPLLIALQVFMVGLVILIGIIFTQNPLFIMGLYLMPSIPIIDNSNQEVSESSSAIGFNANLDE